jgi:hypothetical protein
MYDRKNALVAADMLKDRVVPFYVQQGVPLLRMNTFLKLFRMNSMQLYYERRLTTHWKNYRQILTDGCLIITRNEFTQAGIASVKH